MKKDLSHLDHHRLPAEAIGMGGYDPADQDGWAWQINKLRVIASWGMGWDHVSVSHPGRIPTWQEMHWIKEQFFEDEEDVMQLHPAKSRYVNNHPRCLHMWRPQEASIPVPPEWMVGIKAAGRLS